MGRTYSNNTGVKVTGATLRDTIESARALLDAEVLVGVPAEEADRDDGSEFNNASRAYVHDQGSPEAHIPQREFMRPGIVAAQEEITHKLGVAMKAAMRGNAVATEGSLHQVGLLAQSAIRNKIDEGIPPPLSEYTLRERAKLSKGMATAVRIEMANRDKGIAGVDIVKPLIATGEMRKSITYVIRSRKRRK